MNGGQWRFLLANGCLSHKVERLCLRKGQTLQGETRPNQRRVVIIVSTNQGTSPSFMVQFSTCCYLRHRGE